MRKYIISDPDILGGTPVIKGTRVPIGRILFLLKDGYTLLKCCTKTLAKIRPR